METQISILSTKTLSNEQRKVFLDADIQFEKILENAHQYLRALTLNNAQHHNQYASLNRPNLKMRNLEN